MNSSDAVMETQPDKHLFGKMMQSPRLRSSNVVVENIKSDDASNIKTKRKNIPEPSEIRLDLNKVLLTEGNARSDAQHDQYQSPSIHSHRYSNRITNHDKRKPLSCRESSASLNSVDATNRNEIPSMITKMSSTVDQKAISEVELSDAENLSTRRRSSNSYNAQTKRVLPPTSYSSQPRVVDYRRKHKYATLTNPTGVSAYPRTSDEQDDGDNSIYGYEDSIPVPVPSSNALQLPHEPSSRSIRDLQLQANQSLSQLQRQKVINTIYNAQLQLEVDILRKQLSALDDLDEADLLSPVGLRGSSKRGPGDRADESLEESASSSSLSMSVSSGQQCSSGRRSSGRSHCDGVGVVEPADKQMVLRNGSTVTAVKGQQSQRRHSRLKASSKPSETSTIPSRSHSCKSDADAASISSVSSSSKTAGKRQDSKGFAQKILSLGTDAKEFELLRQPLGEARPPAGGVLPRISPRIEAATATDMQPSASSHRSAVGSIAVGGRMIEERGSPDTTEPQLGSEDTHTHKAHRKQALRHLQAKRLESQTVGDMSTATLLEATPPEKERPSAHTHLSPRQSPDHVPSPPDRAPPYDSRGDVSRLESEVSDGDDTDAERSVSQSRRPSLDPQRRGSQESLREVAQAVSALIEDGDSATSTEGKGRGRASRAKRSSRMSVAGRRRRIEKVPTPVPTPEGDGIWTPAMDAMFSEVEFGLRRLLATDEDITEVQALATRGLQYMTELQEVSDSTGLSRGALSRWVLPFDASTRTDDQTSDLDQVLRSAPPELAGKVQQTQVESLVAGANLVRGLIRIKIADDNDLESARMCLCTIADFLVWVRDQATQKAVTPIDFLSQRRAVFA